MTEYYQEENALIYRPAFYDGPIAINSKPSKECKEYHENSYIQINIDNKVINKPINKPKEDK